jgi:hypothetical protein
LTFAPFEPKEWVPLAVAAVAAVVALLAAVALAAGVTETPITCSSDCSRLLNRPCVVAAPWVALLALESVLEPA